MEVRVLAAAARRALPWCILLAIIGGVLGFLATKDPDATPRADVNVLVEQNADDQSADRLVAARAAQISSDSVLRSAAQIVGDGVTAADLREGLSTSTQEDSNIVSVHVIGPTPAQARRRADALVEAFVNYLDARTVVPLRAQIKQIDQDLNDARIKADEATLALANDPTSNLASAQRNQAVADIAALRNQRLVLSTQLAQTVPQVSALDRARSVAPPASKKPQNILLGAVAGALLGFLATLARLSLSRQVSNRTEAEALLEREFPVTLVAPRRESGPSVAFGEGVAELAVLAETSRPLNGALVVAVGSASPDARVRQTAEALAGAYASNGLRAVLADVDSETMQLGRVWRVALTDDDSNRQPVFTALDASPQPFDRAIGALRRTTEAVVVDCGSLADSLAGIRFVHHADVVVLLVPSRGQRAEGLRQVRQSITSVSDVPVVPAYVQLPGGLDIR